MKMVARVVISFIIIFFISHMSFAQSKKEQIINLTNEIDSLNAAMQSGVLSYERKMGELRKSIADQTKMIDQLTTDLQLMSNEAFLLRLSLTELENQNSSLTEQLKSKNDSLDLFMSGLFDLESTCHGPLSKATITIGSQVWLADNLNVDKFRNGDPILEAKSSAEWIAACESEIPAWCYLMNNPDNGLKYGKLYNLYAVNDSRVLAPEGFHIPSISEWMELTDYLGPNHALKMKSTTGWGNKFNDGSIQYYGNGNNSSGFNGNPSGCRFADGTFSKPSFIGKWWCENPDAGTNRPLALSDIGEFLYGDYFNNYIGCSVRCIQNTILQVDDNAEFSLMELFGHYSSKEEFMVQYAGGQSPGGSACKMEITEGERGIMIKYELHGDVPYGCSGSLSFAIGQLIAIRKISENMYKLQVADHSCSYYPSGCDSQEINGSAPTKNEEFEITIDKSNPNRILIGSTKSKSTCTDAWSFEKCTFIKG